MTTILVYFIILILAIFLFSILAIVVYWIGKMVSEALSQTISASGLKIFFVSSKFPCLILSILAVLAGVAVFFAVIMAAEGIFGTLFSRPLHNIIILIALAPAMAVGLISGSMNVFAILGMIWCATLVLVPSAIIAKRCKKLRLNRGLMR